MAHLLLVCSLFLIVLLVGAVSEDVVMRDGNLESLAELLNGEEAVQLFKVCRWA